MHAIRGRRPLRAMRLMVNAASPERTHRTRAQNLARRTISQGWRLTARRNVNDCTCREEDSPRREERSRTRESSAVERRHEEKEKDN